MNYNLFLQFLQVEIEKFVHIQDKKNLVTEQLQRVLLHALNSSQMKNKLVFLGGTNLRIVYQLDRFSEDLDFALEKPEKKYSTQNITQIIHFLVSE